MTFFQKDHILEAIAAFDEDVSTPVTSAVKKNLVTVKEDDEPLEECKSDVFSQYDTEVAVCDKESKARHSAKLYFLCTRVQKSNTTDWEKLRRLLQFINDTIDEKFALSAD